MYQKFIWPLATLLIGGVVGYSINEVRHRKENKLELINELKIFCEDQVQGCEHCLLFDPEADCCSLHAELPSDWDIKQIRNAVEGGYKE